MQVEYKTEKGTFTFVKVNEAQTKFDLKHGYLRGFDKYGIYETVKLSSDDWKLIGLTSEVSEEQANMMVGDGEVWGSLMLFKSLIQKLQVYEVNPYKKPADDDYSFYTHKNVSLQEEYQEAQLRTGKWVILFKNHEQNNI